MFRFRPTLESLDGRALPSAVFASSDDPTSESQAVQFAESSEDVAAPEAVVYGARNTPRPPPPPPDLSDIPVSKDIDISTTGTTR